MEITISLLPIVMIFLLLFVLRQSTVKAGLIGYFVAVLIAFCVPSFNLGFNEVLLSTLRGGLTSLVVAYVLLFGILLFHMK
jgi:lactate permease